VTRPCVSDNAGQKNSIQHSRIQFKMPCYHKSYIRLKEVSNSTVRLVGSNKRNKKIKKKSMHLFCILKGLCKDFIIQIQEARDQEYLLRFCFLVVLHFGSRGYLRFLFLINV